MALDPRIALMGRGVEVPDIVVRRGQRAQAANLEAEAAARQQELDAQAQIAQIIAREGGINDRAAAQAAGLNAGIGLKMYKGVGDRRVDDSQAGSNDALSKYRNEQAISDQFKRGRDESLFPGQLEIQANDILAGKQKTGIAEPTPDMALDQEKKRADLAATFPAFEFAYRKQFPKAADLEVQTAYAQRSQRLRPGEDIPYSPDVMSQRLEEKRTGAPRTSVTVNGEQRTFQNERELSKEFASAPIVKSFNEVKTQYARAQEAYQAAKISQQRGESANSTDQILINVLNKMLDPNSVVREGEYARMASGQSVGNKLKGYLDQLQRGGAGLSNPERESIMQAIQQLNTAMDKTYAPVEQQFRGMASEYGLNPNRVAARAPTLVENDFNAKKESAAPLPTAVNDKGETVVFKDGQWRKR